MANNNQQEELCVLCEVGCFDGWDIDPTSKKIKNKSIDEIVAEYENGTLDK